MLRCVAVQLRRHFLKQGQKLLHPKAVLKAETAALTVKQQDLQAISDYVNWRFNYTSDTEQRGVPEHWVGVSELADLANVERDEFKDDCDGYALACRYQCREIGIPSRLVYCKTKTGGGHLVLEVDGYILDNRSKWVTPRDAVDYSWIKISGYNTGDAWHLVQQT